MMSLKPSKGEIIVDGLHFGDTFNVQAIEYAWTARPNVVFNRDERLSQLADNTPVTMTDDGREIPDAKTLGELRRWFEDTSAARGIDFDLDMQAGQTKPQVFQGEVEFGVSVLVDGSPVTIDHVVVEGGLAKIVSDMSPPRMALFGPGDIKPWRDCEVIELNGQIAYFIADQRSRTLSHKFIPIREDLIKTIFGR